MLDLSPVQAGSLAGNRSAVIDAITDPAVIFLFVNDNSQVSPLTPNRHFQNAVRYALDYDTMVQVMGPGAVRAPGVIPHTVLGALPAWAAPRRDLDRAEAELAASGVKNPTVSLGYSSDPAAGGPAMSALASMVQTELGSAGISVKLAGSPAAAALADFTAGRQQMGLWSVKAGYDDPNYYLAFLPGQSLGLRAGWPAGADPTLESLGVLAGTTEDMLIRAQLFQLLQGQLTEEGPFFPLLQPGRAIVAASGMTGIAFNPSWSIDLAAVVGA